MSIRACRRAALGASLVAGLVWTGIGGASPQASRVRAQESADAPAPEAPARRRRRRRTPARASERVMIHEGRAMQRFGRGAVGSSAYADALNTIHTAIGERATIYSVIVPTAQEFYCPDPPPPGRTTERPNIMATYALLAPGIRRVDAHAELAQHTDENLYFRTDVHWTGLAGYYAYRAFCTAAGVEPVPLSSLERSVVNPAWYGSLYRFRGEAELESDVVETFVPPARAELRAWSRRGVEHSASLFAGSARGYTVFLGGDHPIMRGSTTTQSGRRVILVKNSYGNAFAVHLVSHYQEVVFIDYRTFRGNLEDVLAESELPTDVVFMNGSLTSNSPAQSRMLLEVLRGRD